MSSVSKRILSAISTASRQEGRSQRDVAEELDQRRADNGVYNRPLFEAQVRFQAQKMVVKATVEALLEEQQDQQAEAGAARGDFEVSEGELPDGAKTGLCTGRSCLASSSSV